MAQANPFDGIAAAAEAWVERNDTVRLDKTHDLGSAATLRVTSLEGVRAFVLQGRASLAERLAEVQQVGESEPLGEPQENADGTITFRSRGVNAFPFRKAHPLRFGKGSGLGVGALAQLAGTPVLLGAILVVGLAAAVVTWKVSFALGLFLGWLLVAALLTAVHFVAKRGVALSSVSLEGTLNVEMTAEMTVDVEQGGGAVKFTDLRAVEPFPKLFFAGSLGGIKISEGSVEETGDIYNAALKMLALPAIPIPASA